MFLVQTDEEKDDRTKDKVLEIHGDSEKVNNAQSYVQEHFVEGSGRIFLATNEKVKKSRFMKVPRTSLGMIIGKNGATIKEIRANSHARVIING